MLMRIGVIILRNYVIFKSVYSHRCIVQKKTSRLKKTLTTFSIYLHVTDTNRNRDRRKMVLTTTKYGF